MATAVMPKQNLNTPQTLWAGLYIIWALDALLLIACITGAQVHRGAMQTIGKDAAPSIIAAQQIKTSLADMDADVANELLGAKDDDYEVQRKKAATALVVAAKNITYGEAEEKPIEAIQVNMGVYEEKVQRARDLKERKDPGFVAAYGDAAQIMDSDLLPQAENLDTANNNELQRAYTEQSTKSIASLIFLLAMAVGLGAALVAVQGYLNNKTHRILNPLLGLATLLTLGFVLYATGILARERSDLKAAKEDAFESIYSLWHAKATAYAANTDESRYLLDTGHAPEHEKHYRQKIASLITVAQGTAFDDMVRTVRNGAKVSGSGYLIEELNNITFPGELEAASSAVARLLDYAKIDTQIRDLETHGKHAEAIQLCTGNEQGQSDWSFDKFDKALDQTIAINTVQFEKGVEDGMAALSGFEIKAAIVTIAIALLAFFGVLKRIQEYR